MNFDAQNVVDHTIENGGGTFNPASGKASVTKQGFAVSTDPQFERIVPVEEFTADVIEQYRDDVWEFVWGFNTQNRFDRKFSIKNIGTWIHEGNVYIDVSTIYRDRWDAVDAGRDANQIAIWDIRKGEEIIIADMDKNGFPKK